MLGPYINMLSLGSPFASLNHFLTGKMGWHFLLLGLMWGPQRRYVEGARFSNACSPALCRPTSATILPEDAEHPKLPTLPGPGGSHSCAAWLGRWDRRWVSPAQPRQLRNEDRDEGGQVPLPGKPHTCPASHAWNIRVGGPPQAISACPPRLGSGAASSRKPSGTPSLKCGPISIHISPVGPQGPGHPLYTPTTVSSWRQKPPQIQISLGAWAQDRPSTLWAPAVSGGAGAFVGPYSACCSWGWG